MRNPTKVLQISRHQNPESLTLAAKGANGEAGPGYNYSPTIKGE